MTWKLIWSATPYGFSGGLLWMTGAIGLDASKFNIFDGPSALRLLSAFMVGFIFSWALYLNGLRKDPPWDGQDRRKDTEELKKLSESIKDK